MKLPSLIALMGLMACGAFAADLVDGKWECGVKGADGVVRPLVATLKSDGMSLTGTVNGMNGQADIEIFEAMNHGEEVMWSSKRPIQNGTVQFDYRGAINANGDEMKITITRADGKGEPMSCVAKKKK
jgi:hypothetical protein